MNAGFNMFKDFLDSYPVQRIAEVLDRRQENRISELGMLAQAFEFVKVNGISGDYFEFGLWRGKTFNWARWMARRYHVKGIKFRGFDSFQGLPPSEEKQYNVWSNGQFAFSRRDFERLLKKKGFESGEYALVEGLYSNSLTPGLSAELQSDGFIATVVYIDCDRTIDARCAALHQPIPCRTVRYFVLMTILPFADVPTWESSGRWPSSKERIQKSK